MTTEATKTPLEEKKAKALALRRKSNALLVEIKREEEKTKGEARKAENHRKILCGHIFLAWASESTNPNAFILSAKKHLSEKDFLAIEPFLPVAKAQEPKLQAPPKAI